MFSLLQCLFLLFPFWVLSQEGKSILVSTSFGLAVVEGHTGFSVDGEISKEFENRTSVGVYYNLMSSNKEENTVGVNSSRRLVGIREVIDLTPESLELLKEFSYRSYSRNASSIGLQVAYNVVDNERLLVRLGGGPTYNIYKSVDISINSLDQSFLSKIHGALG